MDNKQLYELSDLWERELFRTKPDCIERIGLYPIVHDDGEGHINGNIEVSLVTEKGFCVMKKWSRYGSTLIRETFNGTSIRNTLYHLAHI